jgi:hypothetical protein
MDLCLERTVGFCDTLNEKIVAIRLINHSKVSPAEGQANKRPDLKGSDRRSRRWPYTERKYIKIFY